VARFHGSVSNGTHPVSSGQPTPVIARAAVFLFFAVFLVIGAAFGIGIFGKPLVHLLAARQWRSASCEAGHEAKRRSSRASHPGRGQNAG
jgi:hypothetical protein